MAVKISELPLSENITSNDVLPVVDNETGITKRVDAHQVLEYITGSTFDSLTVANTISGSRLDIDQIYVNDIFLGNTITGDGSGLSNLTAGGTVEGAIQYKSGNTFAGADNLTYDSESGVLNGVAAQFTTVTATNISGVVGEFTNVSSSNLNVSGNLVLEGPANLSEYPDYAYIIYTSSYDKLVAFPGLYVSGNLTGSGLGAFQTISASNYIGLPTFSGGNITGSGTSGKLTIWSGTASISEISEISYTPSAYGFGSHLDYNDGSGTGVAVSANSPYVAQIATNGSGRVTRIFQNGNSIGGSSYGYGQAGLGGLQILGASQGLILADGCNLDIRGNNADVYISHVDSYNGRVNLYSKLYQGVTVNPNGNNDVNFKVVGSYSGTSNLFLVDTSANKIAIKKSSANAELDVNGDTIVSGNLTVTGTISASNYQGLPNLTLELTKLTVTSSVSITSTQRAVFAKNTVNSSISITLPSISSADSKEYYIIKADSLSGSVIISGSSPNLINGQATYQLNGPYQSVTLIHDGADWYVF